MRAELKELWRFRELLFSMIQRELRIRYKNSFFGFFWSLITPLATVAVLTVVFKYLVRIEIANYSAYVLAALLPFLFFQQATLDSAQSILTSISLVKKIYFPREILPLAIIISNFIHFLLALVVFFAYLTVVYLLYPGEFPFRWTTVYLPVLLLITLMLTTGVGLLVSALNTFYEDVKYVVTVGLYLLFYLCPIIYFSEHVYYFGSKDGGAGPLYTLYHLNPLAALSASYRKLLLDPQPVPIDGKSYAWLEMSWGLLGIAAAFSAFILWFGYHVFNRMKWRFVERP